MNKERGGEDSAAVENLKEEAAHAAAAEVHDGAVVGLGSGTTATRAVKAIGKRVAEGLRIIGVSTSEKTAELARGLNIPLSTLAEHPEIDVTIDGADEVELGTLQLIKGGGGNLLREKIVATSSARLVIVVDRTKLVDHLGTHFPVPVEVVQFGWETTAKRLEDLRAGPQLRKNADGSAYITDGGNYILDCAFGPISSPVALAQQLDSVVGVVEHGIFIGLTSKVIIGAPEGIKVLNPEHLK